MLSVTGAPFCEGAAAFGVCYHELLAVELELELLPNIWWSAAGRGGRAEGRHRLGQGGNSEAAGVNAAGCNAILTY